MPVLVVVGDRDEVTGVDESRAIAAAVPHARLEIVQGAGHLVNQERPGVFNALVRDFLEGRAVNGELVAVTGAGRAWGSRSPGRSRTAAPASSSPSASRNLAAAAARALGERGIEVHRVDTDVSDPRSVEALAQAVEPLGRLHGSSTTPPSPTEWAASPSTGSTRPSGTG